MQRATIAALTPGVLIPITVTAKYLVHRKSSEIISPDRAFVLCYYIRGASIVLYRTMQSRFEDIWLFVGLSLLHGASNILSKATLSLRIRIWKYFLSSLNYTCCGFRLEEKPLDSPRIRRLNADLEIQNILFEYTAVILSQAYVACYLVVSYEVSPWSVMENSLVRIAICLAIDLASNLLTVFIQIHYYDIPMQRVWQNCWRRHVAANALMIIIYVSHFATVLVFVFANNNYAFKGVHNLRNCTSFIL